ncbi:MAG: hypothetical protein EVG15_10695 [Candidatus Acididesulfobacter diazotrophicus]|jgi:predicted peroxiredoxin|uniref:Uncharacterized protein n=1 Tax=Candidatus Acididesulfobacter diazotrophicus TaxID=2597226 RepID=A0A519BJU1_9DELT|nr:MAG: hypothetical protein EVG15_10695 [Candidatus Acididesulfobacter diazotrophicus]
MRILKEKKEKTIRAYIDKSLYKKIEEVIKDAKRNGVTLMARDIILKGLELKEEEIARVKVSVALKKENYEKFLKLKETKKEILIENIVRAGIDETIEEYKQTMKNFI